MAPARALTDDDLYLRWAETLLASWQEYARVGRARRCSASPASPRPSSRTSQCAPVYNSALLKRDLATARRALALDAMEAAYAAAGIPRFAAWVHESDEAVRTDIERRGCTLDESTRAMGMALADIRLSRQETEHDPRRLARAHAVPLPERCACEQRMHRRLRRRLPPLRAAGNPVADAGLASARVGTRRRPSSSPCRRSCSRPQRGQTSRRRTP